MPILPRLQPGGSRVIGDVIAQVLELGLASDEMVEALDLPEPAGLLEDSVDSARGLVLPRPRLRFDLLGRVELNEGVDVVRHDHEIAQHITLAIAMVQIFRNNAR